MFKAVCWTNSRCLDHDGIIIKIILGNLIVEKTVCKNAFMNIFSYRFLQDTYVTHIDKTDPRALINCKDYWIHAFKTKAPMRLYVEGGYRALILYSY